MSRDQLVSRIRELRAENAKLERLIELSRENAKLMEAATARARAASQRNAINSRVIYARHNTSR